jgi:hypothetical protein
LLQYKEITLKGGGAHPLMTTNDMASQLTTMASHPLLKVSNERHETFKSNLNLPIEKCM